MSFIYTYIVDQRVVVVVVFISTVQHQLVSTAINVYNTDIMES